MFKEYTSRSQGKLKVKTTVLPDARENDGDQVVIDPNLASDRLREWHNLSRPITEELRKSYEIQDYCPHSTDICPYS